MQRATRLADIAQALNPRPLRPEELDEFFVETSDARDPMCSRRDEIAHQLLRDEPSKILLVGHAGSGKSTELVKLRQEHADHFECVSFSLIAEAQVGHASVETILVLIVGAMVRTLERLQCPVPEAALERFYQWFTEVLEIKERDLELTGAVGAGVDASRGVLGKLLGLSAYVKSDIKTGSKTLHKAITKENKRLSELAFQTNQMVKEARLSIREHANRDLLLIIEDLDKASIEEADAFFIENPAPLADLPCKAILTAPMFLLCNPRAVQLESWFEIITLPMIKLTERGGERNEEAWESVGKILAERMDPSLLAPDAADLAIEKTGGVLRHLFQTLETAATVALQAFRRQRRETEQITPEDVRYGLNRLKSELLRRIGVMGLPEEFREVSTQDLYERLREIHQRHPAGRVDSDLINLLLLQAHALIEYNGQGWHRVHPLVAEHLDSQGEARWSSS